MELRTCRPACSAGFRLQSRLKPSGNMRFVMALGCIRMRLTPEQSFNACTINTAYAMGVSDQLGSITVGKKANLIITKPVPSLAFIPYSHQTPVIDRVILAGVTI